MRFVNVPDDQAAEHLTVSPAVTSREVVGDDELWPATSTGATDRR